MKAVERADQLPSEGVNAMQAPPFRAAQVEAEGLPVGVGVARVSAKRGKLLFPFEPAVLPANGGGQRPVEGIALGDPEQLDRGVVDEVRQFLKLVVEQAVAGVEVKLAFDGGDGRELAEDDQGHAQ